MAQGYYISHALAPVEFAAWLKDSPWRVGILAGTGITAGINPG
jgi:hypothetical protein